jgi:uncharacterized protein (DUF427 family)
MKAIWNGAVIAESDDTVVVEGNHYFPRESLAEQHFAPSDNRSVCHWKGTAELLPRRGRRQAQPERRLVLPRPPPSAPPRSPTTWRSGTASRSSPA